MTAGQALKRSAAWLAGTIAITATTAAATPPAPPIVAPAADAGRGSTPCLVCRQPVVEGAGERSVHRGRNIVVHANPCAAQWRADPDRYFATLQPRGVLFDEESVRQHAGPGWLIASGLILAGVLFGAGCAYVAVAKGLRPGVWFGLGFAGNAVALFVLALRPSRRTDFPAGIPRGLRKVPLTLTPLGCACGAPNHPTARHCARCGSALASRGTPESARV